MPSIFRIQRPANAHRPWKTRLNERWVVKPSARFVSYFCATDFKLSRSNSQLAQHWYFKAQTYERCRLNSIQTRGLRPSKKKTNATIRPTTNKIHAILAAAPATPVKPKTPAISATTRNTSAQDNMLTPIKFEWYAPHLASANRTIHATQWFSLT